MATGQGILNRLNALKMVDAEKPGVLPLAAYYRRSPELEAARGAMYKAVFFVSNMTDAAIDEALARMGGEDADPPKRSPRYQIVDMISAVTVINEMAGPLEYLISAGEMETSADVEGFGRARFHTALRLRDLFDGAQVKGLRSPSLSGGGGGGQLADIRGYQLDCMKLLDRVRRGIAAAWAFPLLEALVWRDEWLDLAPEKKPSKASARMKTVQGLHYALDCAGSVLGYIPEEDITQRWPSGAPPVPPSIRRHTRASTAANQLGLLTSRAARLG
ncbi:hypothetical protein [Rhizobium sp. SSA_523]|uniref:hypothetical protein n=1 Tax=Rhizobium sp. SSA_523 TaxID=2952477 RepID=UPI002091D462|nr:hypothetical protein [Rhizobium sp. SSA_523]MCO5730125.1 hypothetical protein [Rhizobium sp. SSA_523]WKC25190.1 hypothetical protein QTJ18_14475 [Rhizobium sp. SSA_523]